MTSQSRFLILLVVFSVYRCGKEDLPTQKHEAYFDLTPGRYIVYDVVEITHDISHDTLIYQLKTVIGDTFIDNNGRLAREFLRYKRFPGQAEWGLTDIWTTLIVDARAELVEENQRIIKLVFPPSLSSDWDAHAFSDLPKMPCYYSAVHKGFNVGLNAFDSALVVQQEDYFTMVDHRRKYEVYAKNIGLIKKHFRDVKIVGFDTTNVVSGKELYYSYISHGIE